MSDVKIQVLDNGPFAVTGKTEIVDAEGKKFEQKDPAYLCRCGLSTTMPYCNGAHEGKLKSAPRAK